MDKKQLAAALLEGSDLAADDRGYARAFLVSALNTICTQYVIGSKLSKPQPITGTRFG